jgi:hypothetical protein
MPKKPGAPPGNLNALKHGFYSRAFKTLELGDLDAALGQGLADEIAMLRVATRRLFQTFQLDRLESLDPEQAVNLLSALGLASIRLGSLMRVQTLLSGSSDPVSSALAEALAEVQKELKIC